MKKKAPLILTSYGLSLFLLGGSIILTGCSNSALDIPVSVADADTPQAATTASSVLRDNTPHCLVPVAPGIQNTSNDVTSIDYSNSSEGYIMANYTGSCQKVKFRITGPDSNTYTYNLSGSDYEAFPLSCGNGSYTLTVYENISGTDYATCLSETISVTLSNEFGPFLYPNQYVNFTADSKTVAKGAELAKGATNDLDVVSNIYNYMISTITYDYKKAESLSSGYISNVDEILVSKTGICLDYAAVMAAMLRSQNIPTHLEVGYAGEAYHAWISTYITDVGWVNGIIEFDGKDWALMDPTFGATTGEKQLKKFIGDGTNYTVKYVY